MNGYLPVESDGELKVVNIDSTRREVLRELLEDMPEDEPVVVFAKFRKDIKEIRNIVKLLGRKSSELSGVRDTLQNWKDGKTSVLVVQISSGCEGVDFTRSRYCVYYSLGSSLIQYKQSRKRLHRPGQTRPVVYYTIVGKLKKGISIDEKIYNALQSNEDLIQSIMKERDI
jgi:ERCC4-related helicase